MLGSKRAEAPKCATCGKTVYPMELLSAIEKSFHKGCFKCTSCNVTLNLKNFKSGVVNGETKVFCQVHVPVEKPSQVASRQLVSQMSAPKLKKSPGIQKNIRMTFQASEYDVQTAPTWGIKPSTPNASPSKPSLRGSVPADSPPTSPQKSFGSRTSTTEKQSSNSNQNSQTPVQTTSNKDTNVSTNTSSTSNKNQLKKSFQDIAKHISFLQGEESEMTVFWSMFANSIGEVPVNGRVSMNVDASETRFEVFGAELEDTVTQFLTSVGAPAEETEVMNQLATSWDGGSGYWVEMSERRGMDGGYLLPSIAISTDTIQNSIEEGYMSKSIFDWVRNSGTSITHVSRDAGQTPPRPVELAIKVTEQSDKPALSVAMTSWRNFNVPELPEEVLSLIKQHTESSPNADYVVRICFIPEGLVRISLAISNPSKKTLEDSIAWGKGDSSKMQQIAKEIGRQPDFIEYSCLSDGFGYQVYKEGPNIRVQYHFA